MNPPTATKTELPAARQQHAAPTLQDIEDVAIALQDAPQVEMPVTNMFAPGIYWRQFFVPAGTFVVGHVHKHEHLNVLLKGRMTVLCDGRPLELTAPMVFMSGAGVAKVAVVHEDMIFATVHPLAGLEECGRDVAKLEEALTVKSERCRAALARKQERTVAA